MRIGTRHWLLAFAGALLLHFGIAAWILWQAPESGAVSTGFGGIEVALGPTGGAPGSSVPLDADVPEAEAATALEEAPTPQPATVPEIRPDPVPDVAVETVEAVDSPVPETPVEPEPPEVSVEPETVVQVDPVEAVDSPEPETPVAPAQPAEAADALPIDAEIAVAAVPVETSPEVAARPVVIPPRPPRKPQRTRAVEPEVAEPLLQPPAPVEQANAAPDAAEEQESDLPAAPARGPVISDRVTAAAPGAGGKSGLEDSPNAGSGSNASAGGRPGARFDYNALLLAWLQKHKEYPRRAKLRQQQGTAMLYLLLDREGRVLEHRIEETSGYALLDREALALVERAQPLPRMPDEMPNARLELIVPVEFFLR